MTPELERTLSSMIELLRIEVEARGGESADTESAYLSGVCDGLQLALDGHVS